MTISDRARVWRNLNETCVYKTQVSFKYKMRLASPFTCAYWSREILNETCVYKTQESFKYEMKHVSILYVVEKF